MSGAEISTSYSTGAVTSGGTSAGGYATSTDYMKIQATFNGWAFPGTWSINAIIPVNGGYPYLTALQP